MLLQLVSLLCVSSAVALVTHSGLASSNVKLAHSLKHDAHTTTTMSAPKQGVVIVGGGPCGLASAMMLARRGWTDITVVEVRMRFKLQLAFQLLDLHYFGLT
jgi:threonine dehydrogenase-like Zn-dependent dehydrogenase